MCRSDRCRIAQRLGVGRQHRHVEPAQREHVALDQRGVRQGGGAGGGESRRRAGILCAFACRPGYGSTVMSTLKDRLTADLRAAMKARDELVTSTLRMALAAVAHRRGRRQGRRGSSPTTRCSRVLTKEAKKRREAADGLRRRRPGRAGREGERRGGGAGPLPAGSSPTTSWPSWSRRRWPRAASPARRRWARP